MHAPLSTVCYTLSTSPLPSPHLPRLPACHNLCLQWLTRLLSTSLTQNPTSLDDLETAGIFLPPTNTFSCPIPVKPRRWQRGTSPWLGMKRVCFIWAEPICSRNLDGSEDLVSRVHPVTGHLPFTFPQASPYRSHLRFSFVLVEVFKKREKGWRLRGQKRKKLRVYLSCKYCTDHICNCGSAFTWEKLQ